MDDLHLAILASLADHRRGLNIREIAGICGIHRQKAARLLDTLELLGQVRKIEIGNAKKYYRVNATPVSGLIDVASDLILVINPDHIIQYLNRSAEEKLGLVGRSITGERLELLALDIFSTRMVLDALLTFTPDRVVHVEVPFIRDDEHLWYAVSIMGQGLKTGEVSIIITAEDITREKDGLRRQDLMISVLRALSHGQGRREDIIREIPDLVRRCEGMDSIGIMGMQPGASWVFRSPDPLGSAAQPFSDLPGEMTGADCSRCFLTGDGGCGICSLVLHGETSPDYPFFTDEGSFWTNCLTDLISSPSFAGISSSPLGRCASGGYASVSLIPLRSDTGIIGLLWLFDHRKNRFTREMIGFYEGLSHTIALALERIRMEREVEERDMRLRLIFENTNDIIWTSDLTGRFTYVSPAVERITGYSPEEWKEKRLDELFSAASFSQVQHLLEKGRDWNHQDVPFEGMAELEQINRDGSRIWAELHFRLISDASDRPREYVGVTRDVSQRRAIQDELRMYQMNLQSLVREQTCRLEEEIERRVRADISLRESERWREHLIRFAPDATFAIDTAGCVIVWNQAMEELTGMPASEMVGKGGYAYALPFYGTRRPLLIDLIFAPTERIESLYSRVQRSGLVITAVGTGVNISGRKRVVWIKAAPLYDENGNLTGTIESVRDITGLLDTYADILKEA